MFCTEDKSKGITHEEIYMSTHSTYPCLTELWSMPSPLPWPANKNIRFTEKAYTKTPTHLGNKWIVIFWVVMRALLYVPTSRTTLPGAADSTRQRDNFWKLENTKFTGPANTLKQAVWQSRMLCYSSVLEPKRQEIRQFAHTSLCLQSTLLEAFRTRNSRQNRHRVKCGEHHTGD